MVRVRDLAGESAAAVLLLVDVAQEWSGVRRARNDTDLGETSEILMLAWAR
jgi:hypothetical protein